MRTISNLLSLNGRVYVLLTDANLSALFLKNAESEGFTFCDGIKPTKRMASDIFAVNRDRTINYVGWVGHMAFYHPAHVVGEKIIRIDYGKYVSGREDYLL